MPNGDKTMKRISHIIHTTAQKTLLYPSFLSTTSPIITRFLLLTRITSALKNTDQKKQNPFSKQHKQKEIALKKRGSTKTQRAKRTLFYEQK